MPPSPAPPNNITPIHQRFHENWLAAFMEYIKTMESPPMFHLWTGLSTLAGVLARKVWVIPKYRKPIYPNFYVLLVAPSGTSRKSTTTNKGVDLLHAVGNVRIREEKLTPEGLIAFLNQSPFKTTATEGVDVSRDCTAYIYAPELSVFLGAQTYASGIIELLTTLYDCRPSFGYTTRKDVDKKGADAIKLQNI
jgi:hypothetical protein